MTTKAPRDDKAVSPAEAELVMILPAGEGSLPRRTGGRATNRVAQLASLLANLVAEGATVDRLAFRKSLEARAEASVKALANDLACYADFCARVRGEGLPASEGRVVAYLAPVHYQDTDSR